MKAVKIVIWIVVGLVVLVGGVAGSSYWWLDGAARKLVEQEGSDALGVTVTLEKLSIGVLKGTASLASLNIANPPGCEKPFFCELGEGSTALNLKSVMDDEIVMHSVELSGLTMYLEPVKGTDKYNYEVILEHAAKYTESQEDTPQDDSETTLVIERLVIRDIKVYYKIKNFVTTPSHIDEIVITDIGRDGAGVDMGELTSMIVSGTLKGVANELPAAIGNGLKAGLSKAGSLGGVAVKGAVDVTKKGLEKLNPFK